MTKILVRDPATSLRDGYHSITDYSGAYTDSLNGNIKKIFYTNVPISIPTPAIRQPDDWSCGPYSLGQCVNGSGETARNWLLNRGLITSAYGTEHGGINAYLNSCGYSATESGEYYNGQMHPAAFDKVINHLKSGYKVILLVGGLNSNAGGPCRNSYWSRAGHYICVYGVEGGTTTSSTSNTTTTSSSNSNKYSFDITQIKLSSTGKYVKLMQKLLKAEGYYTGSIDGSYGPATFSAVKAFQKKKGITQDGICGPTTWGKLLGL